MAKISIDIVNIKDMVIKYYYNNGYGVEVGRPLATNPRIAKIAFTGSTQVGQLIMQYATENIIPVTGFLKKNSAKIFLKFFHVGNRSTN